jgi:hypothetical protein
LAPKILLSQDASSIIGYFIKYALLLHDEQENPVGCVAQTVMILVELAIVPALPEVAPANWTTR